MTSHTKLTATSVPFLIKLSLFVACTVSLLWILCNRQVGIDCIQLLPGSKNSPSLSPPIISKAGLLKVNSLYLDGLECTNASPLLNELLTM